MNPCDRRAMPARWGAYGAWNLSERGYRCRALSEPGNRPDYLTPAQEGEAAGGEVRPQ
jgi:hypothetical protein